MLFAHINVHTNDALNAFVIRKGIERVYTTLADSEKSREKNNSVQIINESAILVCVNGELVVERCQWNNIPCAQEMKTSKNFQK